jgi:hypothetical protein
MKICNLCNLCKREKPESDFYATREGSTYGPCKECRREAGIERYAERKALARGNFERLAGTG